MAIRSVILRGFGNGTFNGTIPLVTLRGYATGADLPDPTVLKMCEGVDQRTQICPETHQRIEMAVQKGQRVGGVFEVERC